MSNEEVFVEKPDIGLDTCTAPAQSIIEWYTPPVVIVTVAGNGCNIMCDVQKMGCYV